MTNLRTGLVEAVARQLASRHVATQATSCRGFSPCSTCQAQAAAAVDAALGFLTDNAEAPIRVEWLDAEITLGEVATSSLIAALSDSRDTGEK